MFEISSEPRRKPHILCWLAAAQVAAGRAAEADATVRRLQTYREYVVPYYLAYPFIRCGDHDWAFQLLDQSLKENLE